MNVPQAKPASSNDLFFETVQPAKPEPPKSDVIMFTNPDPPSFPAAAQPQSTPSPAPVAATPAPS